MSDYFLQGDTLVGSGGSGKDINVLVPAVGKLLGAVNQGGTTTPMSISIGLGLILSGVSLEANWQEGVVSAFGAGISLSGGTLSASGSGGSVTSVSTTGAGISVEGGGSITASGTLQVEWNAGTVAAVGAGLTLSAGSLQATGTFVSPVVINPGASQLDFTYNSGLTRWQIESPAVHMFITADGAVVEIDGQDLAISALPTTDPLAASRVYADATSGVLRRSTGSAQPALGSVSSVSTSGAGISGGPITTIGTLQVEWNAGTVTAVAASQLQVSGSTLGFITGPTIAAFETIGPGSQPLVVNANTAVPVFDWDTLSIVVGKDAGNPASFVHAFGGVPQFRTRRANGTEAAPTAILSGDNMGQFQFAGYVSLGNYSASVGFNVAALENFTPTAQGSAILFSTIQQGTTNALRPLTLTGAPNAKAIVAGGLNADFILSGRTAAVGAELLSINGGAVVGTLTVGSASAFSAIGNGITITTGTLGALWNAGSVSALGGAMAINTGTITDQHQGTLTLSGTTTGTISPANVDSVIVNIGTAAGTIAVSPGFQGQRLRVEIKQGATAQTVTFTSTVSFGTTVPSYTATASATARDLIQMFCVDGTHWAFAAVSQGFTI